MGLIAANGYYLPAGYGQGQLEFSTRCFERSGLQVQLSVLVVTSALVESLSAYLKKSRQEHLARLPVRHIIDVLDEASRRWLDAGYPPRKTAIDALHVITGFSREIVAASIDAEMESSLGDHMWQALCSEIRNPLYLDDFQYSAELNGYSRAFGPELIVSFFSENIPALPHLLFMRAALVKAACLGKVASGEPAFAPLYLKTIEDIDPGIAACMAVLYWQGGSAEVEDAAFARADAAIVFGGEEACSALAERIPRSVKLLVHGHKLGFGVIGKKALGRDGIDALAAAIAYDHGMFDQQACLAPQAYYVEEGGEVSPAEFVDKLAQAMDELEAKLPRGSISAGEAAAVNQSRVRYEIRQLQAAEVMLRCPARGTGWTIACERAPAVLTVSPRNRFVRLWAVEDIFQILPALQPVRRFLQNAAVAIGDERELAFIRSLGELGVSRVTAPGAMPLPSMMWHHDGIAALASLLRWCDIEKKDTVSGLEANNRG